MAFQRRNLVFVQIAELAGADMVVLDRADADALQAADGVTDGLAHPPHLPVAPFVDHHRKDRVRTVAGALDDLVNLHGGRGGPLAVERNAFSQPLDPAFVRHAAHADVILAADLMPRMHELLGQLTVAGQQQEPF